MMIAMPTYGQVARIESRVPAVSTVLDVSAEIGSDSLAVLGESELVLLNGRRIAVRTALPPREVPPRSGYVDKVLLFDDDHRLYVAGDYYGPIYVDRTKSMEPEHVPTPSDKEDRSIGKVFVCQWIYSDDSDNRLWTIVTRRWILQEYQELEILVESILPDSSMHAKYSLGSIAPIPMFGDRNDSIERVSMLRQRSQESEWFPWARNFVPWDTIGYSLKVTAGRLVQINPSVNRRTNPVILPPEGGAPLRAMDFTSDGVGVVVGDRGTIYRTTDFGETWMLCELESKENLTAVEILESNRLVVGTDGGEVLWIRIDDD